MDCSVGVGRWWREFPFYVMIAIVGLVYFSRLGALPVVGEEGRWARGAVQMLESGDWIVPRQQGQVFPERPPMSSWAMAGVGWFRGEVDVVAIRLPSVLAILATATLIYAYSRLALTPLGAFAAAIAYPTLGQVLQIGRHGESEALFTCFVSASLLLWHYGYTRRWNPTSVWLAGYSCMAMAALVKGPQAPAYFVAVTLCYAIVVRKDWSFVFSWSHLAGIAAAGAILAAWQVPFFLMTDLNSVMATWMGLAGDRFELRGLLSHIALYPLETFVCLLPWSPLIVALASRQFRANLSDASRLTPFLFTALAVTYPTVWFASAARGRYFMPLYPLVAVLIGIVVERCVAAPEGSWGRLNWRNFLLGSSVVGVCGSVVILAASWSGLEQLNAVAQPVWFAGTFAVVAAAAATVLLRCRQHVTVRTAQVAVGTIATLVGIAYTGVVINVFSDRWNDPGATISEIRELLPESADLVSFGPVDFRFCYHYKEQVQELPWPTSMKEVPTGIEYFCIDRHPGDTPTSRASGRGRSWTTGPGSLPFEWEEVARVCVERRIRQQAQPEVIVARIKQRSSGQATAMSAPVATQR